MVVAEGPHSVLGTICGGIEDVDHLVLFPVCQNQAVRILRVLVDHRRENVPIVWVHDAAFQCGDTINVDILPIPQHGKGTSCPKDNSALHGDAS